MSTSVMKCVGHCYHGTGLSLTGLPASHQERCCHCGDTRYFTPVWPAEKPHGPYAPGNYTLTMSNKTGSLGDPLLDVFFGKTTHVLPSPAPAEGTPMPACKQEAKAMGFTVLPRSCRVCGKSVSCPAGKP